MAKDYIPSFMNPLMEELAARRKLFADTPPNEVKYWFEYTGPLQKYFYRYSKSRGKADYFEGRDDSGVISARFVSEVGGGSDYKSFYETPLEDLAEAEQKYRNRMLDNCIAMGAPDRPVVRGSFWSDWFGSDGSDSETLDRCRVLFAVNTVGAGKGTTILWETNPPLPHTSGPKPWQSEQTTAAMHLERNLKEIDAMCATGRVAARVQVLVCEPIPGKWTDWMDSQLVNCGGKPMEVEEKEAQQGNPYEGGIDVEERASPVQVVVVASSSTADTCHDLRSGFMEQRMQDLVLAPPYLNDKDGDLGSKVRSTGKQFDPSQKTTHPDLISSDDHDLYVALKWSSLVTTRAISGFLQASADLAASAGSPSQYPPEKPVGSFLIPSFVRMSYVSEENNKVAKWRMHGDFFHPAAWEVCKESFGVTWIPHSLSSHSGVHGYCYADKASPQSEDCGQYWVYMQEEQMPTNPDIYANEATPPFVRGGSNFIWMLTERQRKEIVSNKVCQHENKDASTQKKCRPEPQAVMPLGDLESFFINYMPNTALGKKHESERRPGYTVADQLKADREKVRERKQLKGQDEIEAALFDYTVYPAALFHKDATIKAARDRDAVLNGEEGASAGPMTIKSDYYDVTITKPRAPLPSWCQNMARRGLCTLFADYMRESDDKTCWEACGMKRNWSKIV